MAPTWHTWDTHLILRPAEWDLQPVHGPDHGLHGSEDVLVDQRPEALAVLLRISSPVDDAHLLDERALPALTCACSATHPLRSQGPEPHPAHQELKDLGTRWLVGP